MTTRIEASWQEFLNTMPGGEMVNKKLTTAGKLFFLRGRVTLIEDLGTALRKAQAEGRDLEKALKAFLLQEALEAMLETAETTEIADEVIAEAQAEKAIKKAAESGVSL